MVAKSCRECGTVCQGAICADCKPLAERRRDRPSASRRGYDSKYRAARLRVVQQARAGRPCVICKEGFKVGELVTAEHIIALRHGGGNEVGNLGPAHARCNFGWNRGQGKDS